MDPHTSRLPLGMLPLHPTHYERLGVAEHTDQVQLDQLPRPALAEQQLAWAVLSDPLRREVYDRYLARERGRLAALQPQPFWRRKPLLLTSLSLCLCVAAGLSFWFGQHG
jgi:hypothetical protein